jgi:hypothetical protein
LVQNTDDSGWLNVCWIEDITAEEISFSQKLDFEKNKKFVHCRSVELEIQIYDQIHH